MERDIKYLLFNRAIQKKDGSEQPLFRFQSDLAKAIVKVSNSYGKAESIRPYLNQVLKYDGNKGKPMSSDLKEAIVLAAKELIDPNNELFNSFETELEQAYQSMIKTSSTKSYRSDKVEFNFLTTWQENANRTVIFNREPLEVKYLEFNTDADVLIEILIRNVLKNYIINDNHDVKLSDLYTALSDSKARLKSLDRNEQYFYRYYVSSYNVARKLYEGLFNYITDELEIIYKKKLENDHLNKVFNILRLFNGDRSLVEGQLNDDYDSSFIKVYKTDGFLLSIPAAYYECAEGIVDERDSVKNYDILFSLIVEKNNVLSVSIIENEDLEFWKEEIYYPLYWSDKSHFKVEEISLPKALSHIKRTIKKR